MGAPCAQKHTSRPAACRFSFGCARRSPPLPPSLCLSLPLSASLCLSLPLSACFCLSVPISASLCISLPLPFLFLPYLSLHLEVGSYGCQGGPLLCAVQFICKWFLSLSLSLALSSSLLLSLLTRSSMTFTRACPGAREDRGDQATPNLPAKIIPTKIA